MFSCRPLFGLTVVLYFPCNKRFIYLLHFYVFVYSCHFPCLFFCLPLFLLSVFLSASRLFLYPPDIFQSGFWDFGQDALPDGPIQGLAERLKTTILSSKANSTSLPYHRAYRKWKDFAISTFDGNVFPAKPFHVALYLQHLIEQSHSPSVALRTVCISAV